MADELLPGLYSVRTRYHHHGDLTENLSFPDAMALIKQRFENSNGAVFFASIERQQEGKAMQEEDPTAVEPDGTDEATKPLEGGDQAEDSPPQPEDQRPDDAAEDSPPRESQQEPQDDSQLQTPQPDQAHPPVSDN